MPCKQCISKPVIKLENTDIKLCKSCFFRYFEKKVRKTIRNYKLVEKGDKILVACSGGKDSTVVLYLLNKIIKDRTIKIEGFFIDVNIKVYSKRNKENIEKFCKENNVKLHKTSFRSEVGKSVCYVKDILKAKGMKYNSCAICGVLRRYILNKYARKLKADKLVTGHNMDDEAQSVIMNIFKNNVDLFPRLGPKTGIVEDKRFVPRIKPLYFCSEEEVKLYSKLKKFELYYGDCPCAVNSFRDSIKKMLDDFEKKYPGTKSSIINSYLGILPSLKKNMKIGKIKSCKSCSEPCAGDICKVCELLKG